MHLQWGKMRSFALRSVAFFKGMCYNVSKQYLQGNQNFSLAKGDENMLCQYCGNEISDGAIFCGCCGEKVEAPLPAADVCTACGAPLAAGAVFCTACGTRVEKKTTPNPVGSGLSKNAILGLIAGFAAAALLGLTVLLISLFGGSSEEDVVEAYLDVICHADVDAYLALTPDDILEHMVDVGDHDGMDALADLIEEGLQEQLDLWEEKYGDFESYEFEITREKEYSNKKLKRLIEQLEERYSLELDITAAKELKFSFVIYFEDDTLEEDREVTLMQIDGNWYLLDSPY